MLAILSLIAYLVKYNTTRHSILFRIVSSCAKDQKNSLALAVQPVWL
jgi:hypothetical protein